ncbi:HK97-gp10 family putative phage morphogenesis protein [Streptococcus constellatus subsp. viborgensis]|uniref:HK97-gp10 family putative phage morphogenesis protein n=1 Tax=Streptococcus constellatus TaxID=76860 RepID=UPI0018E1B151|nr:HK97-gp10 family putative phage morphogenesis protein [Streptococcus constellatus]QQC23130.1 HK97 gp10 family phage protein [Streptococcus constellatus]
MSNVKIDSLSSEVMKELEKYADVTTEKVKKAVQNAGKTVRDEIKASAPSDTGKYSKSWTVKTVRETSSILELVVHSKNRYQLTHLLEFGHAKRGGGRVSARPHIANAEGKAIKVFEEEIKEVISNG